MQAVKGKGENIHQLQQYADNEVIIGINAKSDASIRRIEHVITTILIEYGIIRDYFQGEPDDNYIRVTPLKSSSETASNAMLIKVKLPNYDTVAGHTSLPGNDRRVLEVCERLQTQCEQIAEMLGEDIENPNIFIMPNWLISASQVHATSGGPSSVPVEPQPVVTSDSDDWKFKLLPQVTVTSAEDVNNSTVEVIILDTAPTRATFDHAVANINNNPLWDSLTTNGIVYHDPGVSVPVGPKLHVYYSATAELAAIQVGNPPEAHHNNGHPYDTSDHGLFIAGIIHNLAHNARIHLVRVLNDYGVGTIETLALGLNIILDTDAANPHFDILNNIVVNCSLTVNFDFGLDKKNILIRLKNIAGAVTQAILNDEFPEFVENMQKGIEWYCDVVGLNNNTGMIFSAAGNNSEPGKVKRPPLYPAAFLPVIGVGANEDYSHEPDRPKHDGALTMGGKMKRSTNCNHAHKDKNSILSLFLQDTVAPDCRQNVGNSTGWARWAGTSFSSAVVAGCVVYLCQSGMSPFDAWMLLKKWFGSPANIPISQG